MLKSCLLPGVSGAGRSAKEQNLFTEVAEGIHPYGVSKHRHMPEIEQGLSEAAGGKTVTVSFTPHLMPMSRGMLSTIYVKMAPGATVEDLRAHLAETYQAEKFVRVLGKGAVPHTRHVRGSNYNLISVAPDRVPGRAIIMSGESNAEGRRSRSAVDHPVCLSVAVIDNLVKGASGQALQNMNLIMGFPEDTALGQQPMFP